MTYKIKSKYFKQYIHFILYGGVLKENKRLRRAVSARKAVYFEKGLQNIKADKQAQVVFHNYINSLGVWS